MHSQQNIKSCNSYFSFARFCLLHVESTLHQFDIQVGGQMLSLLMLVNLRICVTQIFYNTYLMEPCNLYLGHLSVRKKCIKAQPAIWTHFSQILLKLNYDSWEFQSSEILHSKAGCLLYLFLPQLFLFSLSIVSYAPQPPLRFKKHPFQNQSTSCAVCDRSVITFPASQS